jgi:hypothetical protein
MITRTLACLAAAAFLPASSAFAQTKKTPVKRPAPVQSASIEGVWMGPISTPLGPIRFVVTVKKDGKGGYASTADSPDQGAKGLPVAKTAFAGGRLKLDLPNLAASYDGRLSADGQEIKGVFKQGGGEVDLTLKRVAKAPEPVRANRPQDPKPPFPYEAREVSYETGAPGVKLAGTLTLPKSGGPFPAVLLLTGSGAQNRDEALAGHRPFAVLADYLTRRGIAVLRVDDRGVGGSTGSMEKATIPDFVEDALAGVAFLKRQPEIDPRRIGLAGHSEGGVVGPMAAAKSADVAFVVMLAGTGLPGDEILLLQTTKIMRASLVPQEVIDWNAALQRSIFSILRSTPDPTEAEKQLRPALEAAYDRMPALIKAGNPDRAKFVASQIGGPMSPWFRGFIVLDPREALRKVKVPVLAVIGALDLQVPSAENLPEIEKALKEARNPDATVKELPGLNHLFQTATTGSPSEYAAIEETFAPAALKLIGDWILERTGRPAQP